MNPLDALHLQLRLEGLEVIHGNRLRQVENVPGEDMPLMLIAHLTDQQLVAYYDESIPSDLYQELMARTEAIQYPEIGSLLDFFRDQNLNFDVGHYKTYLFPEPLSKLMEEGAVCFSKTDPRVVVFGFDDFAEQVYGIERQGKIVSACVSARENEQCEEAWVYTDPQYRQHGFAQRVVRAWAGSVLRAGKVPFYSHKIENTASANLAKRLELQIVFEEIAISCV